jgi:hypothetical protein
MPSTITYSQGSPRGLAPGEGGLTLKIFEIEGKGKGNS